MKVLTLPIALATLVACGGNGAVLDAESEAMIDCLASKTVLEITDKVKAGVEAGKSADALRPIQSTVTATNIETLETVFTEQSQKTYFEYQVAKRLNAVQDALNDPEGATAAKATMDETFALAQDCSFGPTS